MFKIESKVLSNQDRILIKGSNSVNLSLITKKLMKEF